MPEPTCTCTPLLSSTAPAWPTTIHQYGCPAAFGTDALGHGIDEARGDEDFAERLRSSMERHKPILDRLAESEDDACRECGGAGYFYGIGPQQGATRVHGGERISNPDCEVCEGTGRR